ncbi:MAG: hypothetical protein VXW32_09080 [Myxococcota bacterium]|nr:hypothetical protein [Myxococcota bacterium]
MRPWLAMLFLAACDTAPTCETGTETLEAVVSFQVALEDPATSLLILPAKPSSKAFEDLIPLSDPYRVLSFEESQGDVELLPYVGPFFEDEESELMLFLVAQFVDTDGDGAHSTGEPVIGLSPTILAYFTRVGCGVWGGKFQKGWNALQLRDSGPAPFALTAFQIPANLLTQRNLELDLAMETSADSRVVLVPETSWTNQLGFAPLVDTPTAESLRLELPEEIPEGHLQSTDVAGTQYSDWFYGVELPLWIENQQALESYGTAAEVLPFCSAQQETAKIGHYPEADTLEEAFHLIAEDRRPGWGLYLEDSRGDWRWVDPSLIGPLSPLGCSF